MKKTYPTSTKSQQWAKHLRPYGKRAANKSTRKINKSVKTDDVPATKPASSKKKKKFAIEFHNGNGRWRVWKKYIVKGRMERSLEALIKKHRNSDFEFMNQYQFRVKE